MGAASFAKGACDSPPQYCCVLVLVYAGSRKHFGNESDDEEDWGFGGDAGRHKSSIASKRQRTST